VNECVTSHIIRMSHVAFKCMNHTTQMTYRVVEMGRIRLWGVYGVASVSRIDKIIGLFCKRAL